MHRMLYIPSHAHMSIQIPEAYTTILIVQYSLSPTLDLWLFCSLINHQLTSHLHVERLDCYPFIMRINRLNIAKTYLTCISDIGSNFRHKKLLPLERALQVVLGASVFLQERSIDIANRILKFIRSISTITRERN